MVLRKILGRNIGRIRVKEKMTKRQLALKAQIDPSNLTKLEDGTQNISIDMLERIAEALGVEPAELLAKPRKPAVQPAPDLLEHSMSLMKQALDTLKSIARTP